MDIRPQSKAVVHPEPGFRIGAIQVDPREGAVTGPGGIQRLDPKVMGVLVMLAERAGHVVSRDDLLARLWPTAIVTDDALTRCLYELRRQLALAGGAEADRAIIETLPKRGYRLNGTVTPLAGTAPAPARRRIAWVTGAVALLAVALVSVLVLRPFTPPAAVPRKSIAVLPFVDMSETPDQQYLGDGLAEEILDRLNQSTDLRVIARTSSFWFRDKDMDIAEIARKLDVSHVLEGSVRRSGDDLRVTAQLIWAQDSSHVWSMTFERKLGDLFAIQDEIAASVASAMQSTLEPIGTATGGKPDLAAYDLVKQGEYLYYRRSPGDIARSVELFEAALEIDRSYARAWADLAGAYSVQAWSTDPTSELLRAKQGEAAHRAVELEPALALAQARLGQYYNEQGEIELARRHFERARELDPDDMMVLSSLASEAADAGDLETAVELHERAVLRDPMNGMLRQNLGAFQAADGRFDEALASFKVLREINPENIPDITVEIARILALQDRHDDAAAEASSLPPGNLRDHAMALLHAAPTHREVADAALARLEIYTPVPPQDTPELTTLDSVRLAEIYAFRGRNDEALTVLETRLESLARHPERRAYAWHLRNESRLSPFLKSLHSNPRWAAFMKKAA